MSNKIVLIAGAFIVVFLLGFVPQYVKANRLDSELRQARQDSVGAELRDLIGLAYVQANQKNYGLAAETSSKFFALVPEVVKQTKDSNRQKALESLLTLRDKVTADLAKGDPAVMGELQDLFSRTREATRSSTAQ